VSIYYEPWTPDDEYRAAKRMFDNDYPIAMAALQRLSQSTARLCLARANLPDPDQTP
jgi:hypothetical protein